MKILLDECVTKKLKVHLSDFEVNTVVEMNWSGLKNGSLMQKAIDDGFDILLAIDRNLEFQQNLSRYNISVVVLEVKRSKLEFLQELIAEFKSKTDSFEKGKAYRIVKNEFLYE
jgi:CII-binding regulator of phage lambda lysogenization HflD